MEKKTRPIPVRWWRKVLCGCCGKAEATALLHLKTEDSYEWPVCSDYPVCALIEAREASGTSERQAEVDMVGVRRSAMVGPDAWTFAWRLDLTVPNQIPDASTTVPFVSVLAEEGAQSLDASAIVRPVR